MVSKDHTQLNPSQRELLKTIFGTSAILHALRARIQHSESYAQSLSTLLTRTLRLALSFQDLIEDQHSLLIQVYEGFRAVPAEELQHY